MKLRFPDSSRRPFRWLRRAVVLAAPLGALALAACCPNPSAVDEVFLIRDPGPTLQPLIDLCRDQTQPDCVPLCRKVTGQASVYFDHCELHPDHDGYVQVHVGYYLEIACL